MIYEPEAETLPREWLQTLQADRLRALVDYAKQRVPLYRRRLADAEPEDIASLDDLRQLPFTRKDDLRDTYPFGMSRGRARRSSGSTPRPERLES